MRYIKIVLVTVLALVFVAAAAIGVLYFAKNKEKKEITHQVRLNTNGSYLTLNMGQIHYELDGQDTGKVVILINGFSVPYYIWDGTFEYLVEQGFKVLRYDLYGRGFSDRPNVLYNRKLYIDQIKEMIEQLHLKGRVNLAGVSFGGIVATDFTLDYPDMVDKLVLIDPAYNMVKPHKRMPAFVLDIKETINADDRANSQLDDIAYPDLFPDWVKKYLPQMEYKGFRRALISTWYNYPYSGRESNTALNAKHKPVLLIWGKEDKTVPYQYSDSIRRVLKTQFLPVEDVAHLPQLEKPDIVNPAIAAFLKK